MPIPVSCPACQAEYHLADHLGGKRVVCRQCQQAFDVPETAASAQPTGVTTAEEPPARAGGPLPDQPAPRARRWEDHEEDDAGRPKSRPSREAPVALILGAVVGGLCLLACAGIGLSYIFMSARPVPQPANQGAVQFQPMPQFGNVNQQFADVEGKLPAILAGDAQPANAGERERLIFFCVDTKRFTVAAARLAAELPANDPTLNDQLRFLCLYNGACGAALAVDGKGEDAKQLPDKVVVMLRRQALRWLRGELAAQAKLAENGEPAARGVRDQMAHWLRDTDLTAVRDPQALAALPDEEAEQWRKLWADVAALRERAGAFQ
jgi:hypothetical protein